ncbi:Negative regulator of beta-lactamase expression [Phaeobacter gallaeciensis]|uniref:N-acetylmuramoyl-L-alanine amidase n=1 Tax=Phaeobacter gallaeciensis TaxID=60890 RepID=UPI000BBC3838|nr:N-acetylmuramoyl-L-alanine amidase [Phaeobacter gallaeciensis]ATF00768.1 Negative regulator of beta-lactamase expression [Phaeobacter gallaeciensis]
MRPISKIIIHCAATHPTQDVGVREIRQWHKARGWSDIGYHAVIRRSGVIEYGRPATRIGAHVRGRNTGSLGVCLAGGHGSSAEDRFDDHFTEAQKVMLVGMLHGLKLALPHATIHGHNEFAAKACPGFRVAGWLEEVGL